MPGSALVQPERAAGRGSGPHRAPVAIRAGDRWIGLRLPPGNRPGRVRGTGRGAAGPPGTAGRPVGQRRRRGDRAGRGGAGRAGRRGRRGARRVALDRLRGRRPRTRSARMSPPAWPPGPPSPRPPPRSASVRAPCTAAAGPCSGTARRRWPASRGCAAR
ncbi:hypothetical protein V2I01_40280 [Micromonospora sp. BRA006-A]|nr:hypothetical protein [Micromonospora sp. BRA006-A]